MCVYEETEPGSSLYGDPRGFDQGKCRCSSEDRHSRVSKTHQRLDKSPELVLLEHTLRKRLSHQELSSLLSQFKGYAVASSYGDLWASASPQTTFARPD